LPKAAVLFCDCRLRARTIAELIAIGDGVPATIELGYHLCFGSEADDYVIQPKDAGIMVEIVNAVSTGVQHRMLEQRNSEKPPNHSGKAVRSK